MMLQQIGTGSSVAHIDLPYVQRFRDRHGKDRAYFRRKGLRVPLPGEFGSPEFLAAYAEARDRKTKADHAIKARSIHALMISYYASPKFRALSEGTQRNYRAILERFRSDYGDALVAAMQPRHVAAILAKKAETPGAAANLRKRIAQAFDHAVKLGWVASNAVRADKPEGRSTTGFRPWTEEDIAQFESAYPTGSRERLALALLLYTAQRRSDVAGMGRQHVKAGKLHISQFKGRRRNLVRLAIPIHPALQAELDAVPADQMTFLVNRYGRPFSHAGFTSWFVDAAKAAGLPAGCAPHGLRKAASRRLAEAGCTAHQIMAITGHKTLKEVDRYTRDAAQAGLAEGAMATLQEQKLSTQSVKPLQASER